MTVTLPLEPQDEAKLIEAAEAKGMSLGDFVREALGSVFESPAEQASEKKPTLSLFGLLAPYGPAPSEEEIDRNRAEMLANFPRSDF